MSNQVSNQVNDPQEFKLTPEQQRIYDLLEQGENVFITGPGGVGKTALIKRFVQEQRQEKIIGLTSTTGISALLFGGQTLHSYTGIGLGTGTVKQLLKKIRKRPDVMKRLRSVEILCIDEISMLSPALFDKLNQIFQSIRRIYQPFGGVQIIASGDFLQLPCIDSDKFCFQAESWSDITHQIELQTIMRQDDPEFQDLLNKVRYGRLDDSARELLDRLSAQRPFDPKSGIRPTRLYPTNRDVDRINERELDKLADTGVEFLEYQRTIQFAKGCRNRQYLLQRYEKASITPAILQVAVGAQVMLTINLDLKNGLVNGSRGVVTGFVDDLPRVRFLNQTERVISRHNTTIEENGRVLADVSYIPLKIAYALTIHKSQGATLDLVEVDLRQVFEFGQAYVALSRVKTKEGLRILGLNCERIQAHPAAVEYYESLHT